MGSIVVAICMGETTTRGMQFWDVLNGAVAVHFILYTSTYSSCPGLKNVGTPLAFAIRHRNMPSPHFTPASFPGLQLCTPIL